jgi:glutaredoxin
MSNHPEDLRLTSASPLELTIYGRPGCHLCEEAKAVIGPMAKEFGATLREVNIDSDDELAERYSWDIPVIFIGAHKAAKHRVDPRQFRRQLQEARERAETLKKRA